jgi:hypothetical protein
MSSRFFSRIISWLAFYRSPNSKHLLESFKQKLEDQDDAPLSSAAMPLSESHQLRWWMLTPRPVLVTAVLLSGFISGFCADLPGFKVAGRYLYDRCGEKVILRGVNIMTVWTDINGAAFPEIAKTGANCVRIVWITTGAVDKFDAAIKKCYENHMIPIVELHDATGKWDQLSTCVDWWIKPEVVNVIQKHEEYLLVNIANECGQTVSDADFKSGYTDAVTRMRTAGIHVPLIIDAAKYGQNIDILQSVGPDLISADPDHNLLLSAHGWWPDIYGFDDNFIVNEIAQSVEKNLPLILGEFGPSAVGCKGIINYKLMMAECQKNEIGWLAWSWGPGNSDCADMDMTTDSTFETLHGWGLEVATTDVNSIKNTSVRPKSMVDGVCEGSSATRFTVSVITAGRGAISMSPNKTMVDSGQVLTITATPDANNQFLNWSGDASGTVNPLSITIDKAKIITAVFSDNGPAVGAELVTNGDFLSGGTGWTFGAWEGAEGTSGVVNGEYVITMTTAGVQGWYAQLNATGLDITKGTSYVVSFKARAESAYDLSAIVGMQADPWTAYSGYQFFSLGTEMKTFTFQFTMKDSSDRNARIVFDVGNYTGKLYLDDVSIKPLETIGVREGRNHRQDQSRNTLRYKNNGTFIFTTPNAVRGSFELYDISGKCLEKHALSIYYAGSTTRSFRTRKLPVGTYIVCMRTPGGSLSRHFVTIVR